MSVVPQSSLGYMIALWTPNLVHGLVYPHNVQPPSSCANGSTRLLSTSSTHDLPIEHRSYTCFTTFTFSIFSPFTETPHTSLPLFTTIAVVFPWFIFISTLPSHQSLPEQWHHQQTTPGLCQVWPQWIRGMLAMAYTWPFLVGHLVWYLLRTVGFCPHEHFDSNTVYIDGGENSTHDQTADVDVLHCYLLV